MSGSEPEKKGSIVLIRKNIKTSAIIALAMLITFAPVTTGLHIAMAQENKPVPAVDKRAEALKKYLEAQNLERSGNFPGAVQAYKEAIDLDPASAELKTSLGSLYLKSRNVIDAEVQAREAAKLAPADINVRKLLAQVYLAQTFVGSSMNKEKAQATIKELEEITKANAKARINIGEREMSALGLMGQLYWGLEEEDKAIESFKKASESGGATDEEFAQLADLYIRKGKYRDAVGLARKAYDANQQAPQYAGLLAKSLLRIGRTQEALAIYEKALGKDKPQAEKTNDIFREAGIFSPLTFDYAEALVFAGKYDEAIKQVDPILKAVRPDSPVYLHAIDLKADALRRAGRRDEAVKELEAALKGQDVSESLSVLYSLAETYEEMKQFNKAIETYEEALGSIVNPDGTVSDRQDGKRNAGVVLRRIALAHRLAGNKDKSFETFDRMKKVLGADSELADQLIIGSLLDDGKNKEALDRATDAAGRYPNERAFKLYRAQASAKLGDLQTTDSVLRSLLKNNDEDADIYLFWSSIQLEANMMKEAEDNARKAISLEPNDISPLITLSIIQNRQKKHKDSEATLRKALEIDPDNATLLNNLGYFLADRGDRVPEAEGLIRRAVNIEPTNGSFLDSLGWVLFKQGKVDEAQKCLEQAVIYSARSATIHDHLGDLYKKQGQTDKARAKWEEALKLATEPEEIKKIKEKLDKK